MLGPSLGAAFSSIREHKGRSFLSALGVLVGTLAVMLLISIALGVRADVEGQVRDLGANLLVVVPGTVDLENMQAGSGTFGLSPFQRKDAEALEQVEGVVRVAKWTFIAGSVTAGSDPIRAFTLGTDPTWLNMRRHDFAEGGPFGTPPPNPLPISPSSKQGGGMHHVVIGPGAKEQLFGDQPALHKEIEINGIAYEVVGVTREEQGGTMFGANIFENIVYIPFDTVSAGPRPQIDRIWVETRPDIDPKILVSRIEAAMLVSQGSKTFTVLTQEDLLNAIYKVLDILSYLVIGISTIALVVGGVGIMTVMLMNVNERRKEIGIRKAVGARRSDIFAQFLFEALLLTVGGGLGALGLTWVAIQVLQALTPIQALLTPGVVLLGIGVSVGIGCIFGLLPALRAAAKDPVESLRQE